MSELNDHSSRAHAFLSASASDRWMHCPASARLASRYPAQDTPFTREGTIAHEVAEAIANGIADDRRLFTDDVTDEMIRHGTEYRDYIESLKTPGCTVMLEQRVDFSAWVPDGFGTADCIILHSSGLMDVVDYKYGQGVEVSAENNPQMQLYGLGAYSDYGFVYDINKVRLHIFQPRKSNISVFETDLDSLLRFGSQARIKAQEALDDRPSMAAGGWCKFCPHAGKCPELAATCIGKLTIGDEIAPAPQDLTEFAISFILGIEPMVTAWLKKVKEQATSALLSGKIIPGYKVVEGKMGNRSWTDEIKVMQALEAAGIPKEDFTTMSLMSPAALDKALGKKKAAELVADLITRSPGAPALVPETDKRPKLDRMAQAQEDFK